MFLVFFFIEKIVAGSSLLFNLTTTEKPSNEFKQINFGSEEKYEDLFTLRFEKNVSHQHRCRYNLFPATIIYIYI